MLSSVLVEFLLCTFCSFVQFNEYNLYDPSIHMRLSHIKAFWFWRLKNTCIIIALLRWTHTAPPFWFSSHSVTSNLNLVSRSRCYSLRLHFVENYSFAPDLISWIILCIYFGGILCCEMLFHVSEDNSCFISDYHEGDIYSSFHGSDGIIIRWKSTNDTTKMYF